MFLFWGDFHESWQWWGPLQPFFFIFQRGDQRVSTIARGIISVFFAIIMVTVIMASFGNLHWLDFLNYCSYIKLAITLIKYVPQAVMNFKRQSTSGWSIGNILLDFTGGTLSMLQMMLNSYNYSENYIRFKYNQMNLLPFFSRRLAINIRRSNQVWLGFVLCPLWHCIHCSALCSVPVSIYRFWIMMSIVCVCLCK